MIFAHTLLNGSIGAVLFYELMDWIVVWVALIEGYSVLGSKSIIRPLRSPVRI